MLFAIFLAAAGLTSGWPALPKWHISTNQLNVHAGSLAADFTIVNDDRVEERFEVAAYSWSQRDGIDRRIADVNDVLIFPRLFELTAGQKQRVRVGVLGADPLIESDYRIAVEQLFDPQTGKPGIHFLLAYDLPLFIDPVRSSISSRVIGVGVHGGSLTVTVRNDGNTHVFAKSITMSRHGESVRYSQPFYVLPGSTMTYSLPMRLCGDSLVTIVPDLDSHIAPLTTALSIRCR